MADAPSGPHRLTAVASPASGARPSRGSPRRGTTAERARNTLQLRLYPLRREAAG